VTRLLLVTVSFLLFVMPTHAQTSSPPSVVLFDTKPAPIEDKLWKSKESRRDALGQETEGEPEKRDEIETDRDSFTPSTTTVGRGLTILESSYTFSSNRDAKEGHSFPELLVRYGLTERLEARFGWNYEISGVPESLEGVGQTERESRVLYGFKYRLTEAEGWRPDSAFILQGFTPTSGAATDTHLVAAYVFGWELPYGMKLDASFRYATASEEHDHFNEWAPSVVLKIPIGEKINVHAEYFGIYSTGKAEEFTQHYFSPGVHYLVTENLELGIRVGWGLNDQSSPFFANAGLGWRF
jgi:hypothetical protein